MPRTFRNLPEFEFWRTLQAVAESEEPAIRERFQRAVRRLVGRLTPDRLTAIERALGRGDIEAAVAQVPWPVLQRALAEVRPHLAATYERAARATAKELQATLRGASVRGAGRAARAPGPAVAELRLTATNPRAVAWLERHGLALVTGLTEESRRAARRILVDAAREGLSPSASVTRLTDVVGLTEHQAVSVANFRRRLEALRDEGRGTIKGIHRRHALSRDMKLTRLGGGAVDRLTERYRRQQLFHRARMIARTETLEASGQAQRDFWAEAVDRGVVESDEWEREVVAVVPDDGRTCEICIDMDGRRAPIGGEYTGGLAGTTSGPTFHTGCRCTEMLRRVERQARAA